MGTSCSPSVAWHAGAPRPVPDHNSCLLDRINLRQDSRRFVFQRPALALIILLAQLAGLVFEAEIAQIFVGRLLALEEIGEARLFFAGLDLARLIENVNEQTRREQRASEEHERGLLSGNCKCKKRIHQNSVSCLAFLRSSSSSASSSLGCGTGCASARDFHRRTCHTVSASAAAKTANGMIQATRLKPVVVGAASTVLPYFCTKLCSTSESLSPRSRPAISSLRMRSE